MNHYISYDLAEDARESKAEYEQAKSEWIRDRANELAEKWPVDLCDFSTPFLRITLGLCRPGAQSEYASMVDRICTDQATEEAADNELINGTFREVA
ncbi:hypothetical protein FOT80_00885 [Serratia fonticola]|nr:hypothetical protein [Serratia fonticola]